MWVGIIQSIEGLNRTKWWRKGEFVFCLSWDIAVFLLLDVGIPGSWVFGLRLGLSHWLPQFLGLGNTSKSHLVHVLFYTQMEMAEITSSSLTRNGLSFKWLFGYFWKAFRRLFHSYAYSGFEVKKTHIDLRAFRSEVISESPLNPGWVSTWRISYHLQASDGPFDLRSTKPLAACDLYGLVKKV